MSDDLVKRLRFGSLTTMGSHRMNLEAANRIEELETKLAKAMDLLGQWRIAAAGYASVESVVNKHDDFLAELTGGKKDGTV